MRQTVTINKLTFKIMSKYKVQLFTGARPTDGLTVANYLGAIQPLIELQKKGVEPVLFVADLHAMTDREPALARKFTNEVVADYLALGLNPEKAKIYVQSSIKEEVLTLTAYLARLASAAEMLRMPTLKEKLRNNANPETANVFLLLYPILMAADILIQRAEEVSVGEDQVAHIEITRELARRFNKRYKNVLPLPKSHKVKSLRILSLKGNGKMSKTSPNGAIFLMDKPEVAAKKIKSAQTAFEKEMNDVLRSHIILAKGLCSDESKIQKMDEIIAAHLEGKKVMGDFKILFAEIVKEFLERFQAQRAEVVKDEDYISSVLEEGTKFAKKNAEETMKLVEEGMFGK